MTYSPSAVERSWSCVLFDLDGTLTDSAPGITRSLQQMFEAIGRPVHTEEELMAYVGPPLADTLRAREDFTTEQADEALRVYRGFAEASDLVDNAVFPGIVGLLQQLQDGGIPVALATSKPVTRATRILEHFDLARYFTFIGGASDDESRSAKADVIAYTLAELARLGVDVSRPVMVGDRFYDVEGANANDVPAIMVEWGYGSPAEATGAIAVVHSVDQLRSLLLGQAAAA
ncbi:HAD hydrolase-like protein [Gryllotalpicola ginsengisoli]|uniref:HAD hydrolase-like protein n=1 Tax=Gryllotalpicola ginsengisoli TaxID=444608 RepID=UPI0003B3BC6A|nr:HAD hydrolase-like protein [Gryllotalpicola ginsengisoli]